MIIDAHAHVGPHIADEAERSKAASNATGSVEYYIRDMDEAGIDMGITFGMVDMDNKYQAEIQRKYPNRIISCAWINPRKPDAADEYRRCVEEWGLRGLKLHGWWHQFSNADHVLLDPLMVICEKYHLPVIMHTIGDNCLTTPMQLEEMAKSYPTVTFVMAHGGGMWLAEEGSMVSARNSNVIMDTSAMEGFRITHNARALPHGKLAMGSDWPWNNLKTMIFNIKRCISDPVAREWAMGRSIADAFGIEWK